MTHDYKRNGTTNLSAAFEILQGRAVGECFDRHRHQEILGFLRRLDQEFPRAIPLHIGDGQLQLAQASQGANLVAKSSPLRSSFFRTSSIWLNLVERWFGELTSKNPPWVVW
jgi:hypothetical protein